LTAVSQKGHARRPSSEERRMSTIEDQPDPPAREAYEETGSIEPPQDL
jgi:hypothetical protein